MRKIVCVDSHTEGEPTRVVLDGAPDLGAGSAAARLARFRSDHDAFRRTVVCEPRGWDALVGALILPSERDDVLAQVVFFNNVGYLGMCVHGTIGVVRTLAHLGRMRSGRQRLETPVGDVDVELLADERIRVRNVASRLHRRDVVVDVPEFGEIVGDIAWGGNWFFLIEKQGPPVRKDAIAELTRFTSSVKRALAQSSITGADGAEIDHVEVFGPPERPDADSKNFVLCPGEAYDRSPCGTGTSAKLAALFTRGKLRPGEIWRQESIVGSLFEGSVEPHDDGSVTPTVSGRAFITGEITLTISDDDPFGEGIA